jgi:hypothetical protein
LFTYGPMDSPNPRKDWDGISIVSWS